jgi:hypothetical protein
MEVSRFKDVNSCRCVGHVGIYTTCEHQSIEESRHERVDTYKNVGVQMRKLVGTYDEVFVWRHRGSRREYLKMCSCMPLGGMEALTYARIGVQIWRSVGCMPTGMKDGNMKVFRRVSMSGHL